MHSNGPELSSRLDVLRMPPEVSQRISVRHGWSRGAIDVSNAWAVLLHSFGPHTPFKKYGPALGCTKGKIRNDIRAADGTGHCLTKLVFLVLWPRRVFFTVVRCCCSSLLVLRFLGPLSSATTAFPRVHCRRSATRYDRHALLSRFIHLDCK